MQTIDWTTVTAPSYAGNGCTKLPAGGYVIVITAVEDDEAHDCLKLTYDIAEGEYTGYYDAIYGIASTWAHTTRQWHAARDKGDARAEANAESRFRAVLDAFAVSNAS